MQTSKWGPCAWDTFFIFSRNYPACFDPKNAEHCRIRRETKKFYGALPTILPCKYCRASFTQFVREEPIDNYLDSCDSLTAWLWIMKDKVNRKLIKQEHEEYRRQLAALLAREPRASKKQITELKRKVFYTTPSPPLAAVIAHYDKFKAKCSPAMKTCREKADTT